MFAAALRVALVAVSLALDVFAVSVGVGVGGVRRSAMVRIGLSFASAEVLMNLVGAGIGAVAGRAIGGDAEIAGGWVGEWGLTCPQGAWHRSAAAHKTQAATVYNH